MINTTQACTQTLIYDLPFNQPQVTEIAALSQNLPV